MKEDRWERNARHRNAKRDRKMPLLAWGGIAQQVVPDWTAGEVEDRITRLIADYRQRMDDGLATSIRHTEAYIFYLRTFCPEVDLEVYQDQWEQRGFAKTPEYYADFWCTIFARHTSRTKAEAFQYVNANPLAV